MPPSLTLQTINTIETALAKDRTVALDEVVQLIQKMAARAFSISIDELAELIGRDPAITEKVISSANTIGYNPAGTPIATISESIHTVGFERIRNLAIILMLAESSAANDHAYEQREAAALCVTSGMLAKELRERAPSSYSNPELLFVCSSLRNYGQLLLATFANDDFQKAKAHALEMSENEAFRKVFGITPLGLSRHILGNTNLPVSIKASLQELTPGDLSSLCANENQEILLVSELAKQICAVVFDERIGPDDLNMSLVEVLSKFARSYPVSLEDLNESLIKIESDLAALNRAVGLSDSSVPASRKLNARLNSQALPPGPAYTQVPASLAKKPKEEMDDKEREIVSNAAFEDVSQDIASKLLENTHIELETLFTSVCRAFKDAAALENSLIFVREEFDTDCLSARYGEGPLFPKVKNRPIVTPAKKDIFSICLTRREDILIQDTSAGKIASVIPDWIHTVEHTSSLIILPVNLENRLQAIIVGTVTGDRSIDLSETDLKHLRSLRSQIAELYRLIESRQIKAV